MIPYRPGEGGGPRRFPRNDSGVGAPLQRRWAGTGAHRHANASSDGPKGIFSKSLTDKLTPFIEGAKLTADGVEVSVGKFQTQIYVEDREGSERASP